MTYVIIQIPCLNEAETLPLVLKELPSSLPGVDKVEWQIIDDGCTDDTVPVALANGVHHVVSMGYNQGLARAFIAGIEHGLNLGADIIVNTDADNQYCSEDIEKLVTPILENRADMVVGARPIASAHNFSRTKKAMEKFGSWVVRKLSGVNVSDAPSGFRAVNRRVAKRLNVYNEYTYTLETLIQAGQSNIRVLSVPIRINEDTRPSRLVRSIWHYIARSVGTILRVYLIYRPLRSFAIVAACFFVPGFALILRFLYYYAIGQGDGWIQSVVLGSSLVVISILLLMIGILSDLISVNRRLLENVKVRLEDLERVQSNDNNK